MKIYMAPIRDVGGRPRSIWNGKTSTVSALRTVSYQRGCQFASESHGTSLRYLRLGVHKSNLGSLSVSLHGACLMSRPQQETLSLRVFAMARRNMASLLTLAQPWTFRLYMQLSHNGYKLLNTLEARGGHDRRCRVRC